ncbi:unnamed protein product [Eruca vesicaria subsp. sativa]|uniref:Uncharacterized protein n=1 Tax=Eruca vesicaria subsp. sativa TaxID=29727 RepID=A0ABC8L5E0_ERUVS|nr:unnamed protein product [Eruca vesicaria subsp. sativa]
MRLVPISSVKAQGIYERFGERRSFRHNTSVPSHRCFKSKDTVAHVLKSAYTLFDLVGIKEVRKLEKLKQRES